MTATSFHERHEELAQALDIPDEQKVANAALAKARVRKNELYIDNIYIYAVRTDIAINTNINKAIYATMSLSSGGTSLSLVRR